MQSDPMTANSPHCPRSIRLFLTTRPVLTSQSPTKLTMARPETARSHDSLSIMPVH